MADPRGAAIAPRFQRLKADLAGVDYRALAFALTVGALGGALFAWLRLPLPWMIGAMTANLVAAVLAPQITRATGLPAVKVPRKLRSIMIVIIGVMLGSAFTPEILGLLGQWAITLSSLLIYIVVCLAVGYAYLRWMARYDAVTSYFTAAPGGLNEMIVVGGASGGDERVIGLSHTARIMIVVFTIPVLFVVFAGYSGSGGASALGPGLADLPTRDWVLLGACIVGAPLGQRLGLPAAMLVGPMILSAVIHLAGITDAKPPAVLVATAQVVVGSVLGCRFVGTAPRLLARIVWVALGLTLILLAITALMVWGLHGVTGLPWTDLILAYAPGGLAEMSLVALALDADAAFVSTHHIARIVLVILLAPVAFRLLDGRLRLSR